MKKYYCATHTRDHSKPLSKNEGLCNAVEGCNNLAKFEVEEEQKIEFPESIIEVPEYGYITNGHMTALTREEYLELKRSLYMDE